jgi:hypothetical protein
MKKNLQKFALLCIIVLIGVSKVDGQSSNEEGLQLRPFGLGLHVEQFRFMDLYTSDSYNSITSNFLLIFNAGQHFRIEPEIGILSINNKDDDNPSIGISLGSGFYGMVNKNNVNIYSGIKVNFNTTKYDNYNGDEVKLSLLKLGPAIGGEYYFSPNFSFGGEICLKYTSIKQSVDDNNTDDEEVSYISTESGLFVRFFF